MRLLFEPLACDTLWVTCAREDTDADTRAVSDDPLPTTTTKTTKTTKTTTRHFATIAFAHAPRDVNERHVCTRASHTD